LRADGDSQIGLGHVHRLLALSEVLQDFFKCTFVIRSPLPGIQDLIRQNGADILSLEDVDENLELDKICQQITNRIIVLDGYHFGTSYQRRIKESGGAVVCIDDIHQFHFVSDVVINTSGGVSQSLYSKERYTRLYSGPAFALLKKPFRTASKNKIQRKSNDVFICMGGADPDNHTASVLRHCLTLPFENYHVVIGEAYRHKEGLLEVVSGSGREVNILVNATPEQLAETMRACATAVCSASGIAYEYLSVRGALYIKQTASNQTLLYRYLLDEGLAFRWEDIPVDAEKISDSINRQQKIFDGNADKRLLKIFHSLDFQLNVTVRRANQTDLMTVFQWANDPELRKQSYRQEQIDLKAHTDWFTKKITDPTSVLYIFDYKNIPLGQVRFELKSDTIVSYSIDKMFRGRGWGFETLRMALSTFKKENHLNAKIIGYVKQGNVSSNAIFEKLGFVRVETDDYPDSYKYEHTNYDRD
jgi:UDP-2,4-diacetamido-2,4,6-trideoxy-beta-L-altropyranose hydrolase